MFRYMDYALAVYEEKSFTKAAEKLFISQPSLSLTIKKLEDVLGMPVFDRAGKEIVQLYISDNESSLERPVKELKGFKKIALEPGEKKTVTFVIEPDMLKFYDPSQSAWVLEKGEFTAHVGAASDDIRSSVEFAVK